MVDARFATRSERVQIGPADRARFGAHSYRLNNVAATAYSTITDDVALMADSVGNGFDGFDYCGGAFELASAVVGQHQAFDAMVVDGPLGIIDTLNTFQYDGSVPVFAEPFYVAPFDIQVKLRLVEFA